MISVVYCYHAIFWSHILDPSLIIIIRYFHWYIHKSVHVFEWSACGINLSFDDACRGQHVAYEIKKWKGVQSFLIKSGYFILNNGYHHCFRTMSHEEQMLTLPEHSILPPLREWGSCFSFLLLLVLFCPWLLSLWYWFGLLQSTCSSVGILITDLPLSLYCFNQYVLINMHTPFTTVDWLL